MMKLSKSSYCAFTVIILLNLSLVVVAASQNDKSFPNILKTLPGFSGDLPFKLETGYIGVGSEEEIQLFYYLVQSERNPRKDPLLVWLTGGPGCSSLFGLAVENVGPLTFNYTGLTFNYTTSSWEIDLPELLLNPYSWTKEASIIFLDQPVATGFSYGTTAKSYYADDVISSKQSYEFLKKWLMNHPEFINVPLLIGGSSYVGKIVPIITNEIVKGNEAEDGFKMNLKGYVLGNPVTATFDIDRKGAIIYAHRVSLIPDELYESTMKSCKGENMILESKLPNCRMKVDAGLKCILPLGEQSVLETKCNSSIKQGCPENDYLLGENWANNAQVRKALRIPQGVANHWEMCSKSRKSSYSSPAKYNTSVGYHQQLSKKFLNVLIFSGDQDPDITYVGTQHWIKKLKLSIAEGWRPWFIIDQVAGYVTKYSNGHYNLTFTTIKGGSHVAAETNPRECFAMFQRWLEQHGRFWGSAGYAPAQNLQT